MTKEDFLAQLKELSATGQLSRDEVLAALGQTPVNSPEQGLAKTNNHFAMANILYGLGGLIVVAGIIFLIIQMWDSFGAAAQILVTLGSAMSLYIAATLLYQYKKVSFISLVLFTIAAILMPIGIYITLYHLSPGGNIWLGQLIMAGIPTVVYFASAKLHKHPLLLFIAILLSTWASYALVGLLLDGSSLTSETLARLWTYFTLMVGISYSLLGYSFQVKAETKLSAPLYFLGAGTALGAGYTLTFMQDMWVFLFFLLILLAIYLSTAIRSQSFLVLGALALMAHLTHISFKYFANSFGWPLALIISGFLIIAIGYATVFISQRFIKNTSQSTV